jgi:protein-S-isoprenylcysteine O-methyltransferase Ste14
LTEPLVFGHGAPHAVFEAAIGTWAGFELVMMVRQRWRVGRMPPRDPSGLLLGLCIAGSIFAAVRLGRDGPLRWPGGRLWPVVAGLCLVAAGMALRAWSIAALGRFFQYRIEVQADHRVVGDGPYRLLRHPSYSGLALILLGIGLASGDVLSPVAVAIVAGAGLLVRIRIEERQLIDALGTEYERFAAGRRRLIPGVW